MQNGQPNHRILVVDDNPAIHSDFQKIFRSETAAEEKLDALAAGIFGANPVEKNTNTISFDLHFASQGQEALEMVRKAAAEGRPYAMAFMDVRMPPGWDGIETTMRLWEVAPDLQVAICTAFSDYSFDEIRRKLPRPDQFVILKKPFETIEVMQLANAFTEKWRLHNWMSQHVDEVERTIRTRTEELIQTEARYRLMIEQVRDYAIYMLRVDGHVATWNNGAERTKGYTAAEIIGRHFSCFYPPEQIAAGRAETLLREAAEKGRVAEEGWRLRKDGTQFWASVAITAIRDNAGRLAGFSEVVRDITARRKVEEELRVQSSALEAAANGIVITDRSGRILWVNPAFSRLTGYAAEEVIGKTPALLKSGHHNPEFYRSLWETILAGETWRGEIVNRRKDGRLYCEEMSVTPILDNEGVVQKIVAVKQDVTDRKEAEKELRRREESFRALSDNVPDAVARVDTQLRFMYGNRMFEQAIGISSSAFIGKTGAELNLPPHREFDRFIQRVITFGKSETFNFEIEAPQGTRYYEARLVPEKTPSGEVGSVLVVARDMTSEKEAQNERQLLELQLRQSQKLEAIGQLAAGIAHEINTPAQYVGDNTRFLREAFAEIEPVLKNHGVLIAAAKNNLLPPDLIADAERISNASDLPYLFEQVPNAIQETLEGVERINKIVRAMKEFSHPGGKEKAAADINKAIESTVTVARNEWKYVAEMKLNLDPELPPVPCFLGEINQSILNLIVNAAHAIGDVVKQKPGTMGAITVSTHRDGEHVEIRVSDTGTGIPESVRPHIFEPFFTTKEVGKGTGQGLNIAYGCIVKKHGGTVRFETEIGKGTVFILRLPLSTPSPENELPQTGGTSTTGAPGTEPEDFAAENGEPAAHSHSELRVVS